MKILRRDTRKIRVGSVEVGGDSPISVQSMTKTDTRDIDSTISQVIKLADSGCEIVRIAIPDEESVDALSSIKENSPIPIIADCHFDYKLALAAIGQGVDGIRINPGNIRLEKDIRRIIKEAKANHIPIRIGINSGSLQQKIYKKYQGATAEALFESAMQTIKLFESEDFQEIKISLKSSDVRTTIDAYRMLSKNTNYPLHLGVTEAGGPFTGSLKSAVALGVLLADGIGDTIRVSITGDPVLEVRAGYEILQSLGLRKRLIEIVSCPTCGRCKIDLFSIAEKIEKGIASFERRIESLNIPIKIAIMGCVVNGPGEAKDATVGVAGGMGKGVIFKDGRVQYAVSEDKLVDALLLEVRTIVYEYEKRI